jgi:flagellar motor protein MotB
MRLFIIGLSVSLFALSGIITLKAFQIPGNKIGPQNSPRSMEIEKPSVIAAKSLDIELKKKKDNQVFIEDSQTTTPSIKDKPANINKVKKEEIEAKPETSVLLFSGIFLKGQVDIDENLKNSVIEFIPYIMASPDHQVIIEGHTDNVPIGPSIDKFKDNIELSYFRAKSLASVLEKNGVPLDRITVIGYGDALPTASNESDEGRIKNRRVEVKLIPNG